MSGEVLGGEPVGQLHQHFRRPRFTAVEAADQMIERLRLADDLHRLGLGERPRVRQLPKVAAIPIEVGDRFLGPHEHDDALASLVACADGHHAHARRGGRKGPVVLQDVGVVRQRLRLADVVAEHVLGGRHAGRLREVIHKRAQELGFRRPFTHEPGEFLVVACPRGWGFRCGRCLGREARGGCQHRRGGNRSAGRQHSPFVRHPWIHPG